MEEWLDKRGRDGWMERWMERRIDGWMVGWMEGER